MPFPRFLKRDCTPCLWIYVGRLWLYLIKIGCNCIKFLLSLVVGIDDTYTKEEA